jgi:hypothetical protein
MNHYMKKNHGVLTNIPGPATEVYFTIGEEKYRILSCVIYPPALCEGSTGMGISSYNGQVRFGALADDTMAYPDQARKLSDGVYASFEKMLADARETLKQQQQQQQ